MFSTYLANTIVDDRLRRASLSRRARTARVARVARVARTVRAADWGGRTLRALRSRRSRTGGGACFDTSAVGRSTEHAADR